MSQRAAAELSSQRAAAELPSVVSAAPRCTVDDCGEPAVVGYVWPWGESGYACAKHQIILGQKSKQLKRQVQFTSLVHAAPKTLTRDERTQLMAARLSAEAEVTEVKERNAALFNQNQDLVREVGRLATESDELRSQLADVRAELDETIAEKQDAKRQLVEKTDELARAKGLLGPPS